MTVSHTWTSMYIKCRTMFYHFLSHYNRHYKTYAKNLGQVRKNYEVFWWTWFFNLAYSTVKTVLKKFGGRWESHHSLWFIGPFLQVLDKLENECDRLVRLTLKIITLPSFKFDVSIEHVRFEQLLTLFTSIFQLLSFPYRIYITIQYPFDHVTSITWFMWHGSHDRNCSLSFNICKYSCI